MLPHEAEVMAEITKKYRVQLEAMTDLHNAIVAMMTAGSWAITKKRGVTRFVVETMMGLLVKACKTFRSIQILCARGLYGDASALVRVLMETAIAMVFILQTKSTQRTLMYHAHGLVQQIRMLNEWTMTPGLKRFARKRMIQQATQGLAQYMAKLPPGTDVKRHWSGKGSLQAAMRSLPGGAALYALGYRHTSSIAHVADFGAQFEVEPRSGDYIWEIEPTLQGFEAPSYAARQLLWHAAHRIDERLGLGFAATLAPFQLTRADVEGAHT